MPEKPPALETLLPIPGDTFALRAELKTLGAVWDAAEKQWRIAPSRLPLALAIVQNHSLAPAPTTAADIDALPDPFEDESAGGTRLITLDDRSSGGSVYAAREALRAVGAQWDKERRTWRIREDKVAYAHAIVASVAASDTPTPDTVANATPSEPPPVFRNRHEERSGLDSPFPAPGYSPDAELGRGQNGLRQEAARPPANTMSTSVPKPIVRRNTALPPPHASRAQGAATQPMPADRIKLGGLWLNRSKDGRQYLSGRLSPTVKILIFPNDFKTSDNQPSHVMYLAPIETDETPRQAPPADSFFGGEVSSPTPGREMTGEEGDDEAAFEGADFVEEFLPEEDETPPPPPARPGRPQAAPAGVNTAAPARRPTAPPPVAASAPARPTNGNGAAAPGGARRPPASSASAPPRREAARDSAPADEDGGDFEDPFA